MLKSFCIPGESKWGALDKQPYEATMLKFLVFPLCVLILPSLGVCDGMDVSQNRVHPAPEITEAPDLDKRLPPVIPGQKIEVSGQKMRVWSTSGPVPVSPVPRPPRNTPDTGRIQGGNGDISVIVDRRGDSVDRDSRE